MLSEQLIPIESKCFDASGYFGGRACFRFRNGRVIFKTIPVRLWQDFMAAPSRGDFYNRFVKGKLSPVVGKTRVGRKSSRPISKSAASIVPVSSRAERQIIEVIKCSLEQNVE